MSTGVKGKERFATSIPTPRTEEQLRRDRFMAIVVLAIMLVVMAITIWLGTLSGGPVEESIDYWHMMP